MGGEGGHVPLTAMVGRRLLSWDLSFRHLFTLRSQCALCWTVMTSLHELGRESDGKCRILNHAP